MIKRIIGIARTVGGKAKFLCEMADGTKVEKFLSEVIAAFYGNP